MKTMIYRAFSLMLLCLALVSCKDDFDIQKLQDHSRLVVYCFPTEGDTTLVSVAKSLPVASVKGNVDILSREKVDAHIIYKVNGVEQTVKRIANEEEAQLFTRSTTLSTVSLIESSSRTLKGWFLNGNSSPIGICCTCSRCSSCRDSSVEKISS